MRYDTGMSLVRPPGLTTALASEGVPLTSNTVSYVDPHLLVLGTLLAFWGVYALLRLRDAVATAI
jgi:hypothetical protein